ncbi:ATP-binding protein [Lysobacter auxotrophicus]|uniref:ATP-binding protein n=1 Tax=Lysobacter auxotrophicus TaxID=2992573 RepID=A0ABN6UP75_9GAMM|nr:ATP-binding protein [Lysobacter auxotrophicus]BDU16678.1 ATP-binding protein [Lysobacter auxotrophicus]
MPQSPELAGGEGFTYEGDAAAYYLAALLAEAYAPGVDDRIVVRLSVQQRDFGEPLDDVIVDFADATGRIARLSLQVKRALTISAAATNADFRDIVRDAWATLHKPDFRADIDRYGAAVGEAALVPSRALKTICDWARDSLTADHFDARFAPEGSASEDHRKVRTTIEQLLAAAKTTACTREELHRFLAHFVLVQFDFLREGSVDPPHAINLIRSCLASESAGDAPMVWSRLVELARAAAGTSGQFDRARLVRELAPLTRLRAAPSLQADLGRLTELAHSQANLIVDDIGGAWIDRSHYLQALDAKFVDARFVQVRGLPGSGKSAVVKQAVRRALAQGPVLFLKAEQVDAVSWNGYAISQGLSATSLETLLVEIAAVGTPTLFIDAIDRVATAQQPVFLQVIQTIATSPELAHWRIVASLRDTGIEVLRNWLGEALATLSVETLTVGALSEEEADALAEAKPHLRPLLFGAEAVREIVRRPFFAKVLDQSFVAAPDGPEFAPRAEVDLIEHWWTRGGYNAAGQNALARQRALLGLARARAKELSRPIRLGDLPSADCVEELRADGILQHARHGISVQFAHDIFFEWAFFHVLADLGPDWIDAIRAAGEPPAVARVVELASQWEYSHGDAWAAYLAQTRASDLRAQWTRAWLLAPLGTAAFEADPAPYWAVVAQDDFALLRKALVWFQAEKTTPNPAVLAGTLPDERRQRVADLLGWPSDLASARRLLVFLLVRIPAIPQTLYPAVLAVFELWQNAFEGYPNAISRRLLGQCDQWLGALDAISNARGPDENSAFWQKVQDLGAFRTSLIQLILRSSLAEPSIADALLLRAVASHRIRRDAFEGIVAFSPRLAQSLPQRLVELALAYLREELPEDRVAREQAEQERTIAARQALLNDPARTLSRVESARWSAVHFRSVGEFSSSDWEQLAIHDDHRSFWPPSPLREPFASLFRQSPQNALNLLRELCNHAIAAWRQLHRLDHESRGTPLPLELSFPWGRQTFWGGEREYLWCRSTWAPKAIGCGFLALEEWCLGEIERGTPVDDLIQQIVAGNDCIAILGTAAMLALHTGTVSATTLPLFTSQRLLAADRQRVAADLSPSNLMGFTHASDRPHHDALRTANARPVRKLELRGMVPRFVFAAEPLGSQARSAIEAFAERLPYEYEEDREDPEVQRELAEQATEYAELADQSTYQAYRTDNEHIALVHVSPSAAKPENVAKLEQATQYLSIANLWTWASTSFEKHAPDGRLSLRDAVVAARGFDAPDLFAGSRGDRADSIAMHRGAVASTAAVALTFRAGSTDDQLKWARGVLWRAARLKEEADSWWSPSSVIPWHHGIYAAHGLAADLRAGTAARTAAGDLLALVAHPLEAVSLAAVGEACNLWAVDPKLTMAALFLAFSRCHVPHTRRGSRPHAGVIEPSPLAVEALRMAGVHYDRGTDFSAIPRPPPAWVKAAPRARRGRESYEDYEVGDASNPEECWTEPASHWHSAYAAEVLARAPISGILQSDTRNSLLDFLADVLSWTIQKNAPPWVERGRRDRTATRIFEWTHALGSQLGNVAGCVPLSDFQPRFLEPVLQLEGENCWAMLGPFASAYICRYIYDAQAVPADAVAVVDLCLTRLLADRTFKRDSYRAGELSGLDLPKLVETLMFVSIERAELASRYVNGDWSEIGRIMPLVDRYVRAAGWAVPVMDSYLTLCERSRAHYPSAAFADQVLAILTLGPEALPGWRGTLFYARIAGLIQHLSHRDAPMSAPLAQAFLRTLDHLIDMGDRRSAALQLGEGFRDIRLNT